MLSSTDNIFKWVSSDIVTVDNEDNFERSENITELVSSDSVVAVKAEDDNIEYYMLKVTSGLETLSTTEKDSWGSNVHNQTQYICHMCNTIDRKLQFLRF
jgi:hypothetical protein